MSSKISLDTAWLDDWFAKYGFLNRKQLFWYTCNNGLLCAVGFDNKPFNYEALYFVQPLYDYSDCFVLDYGDTLVRKYARKAQRYLLYKDMEQAAFDRNLDFTLKCFEKDIISFLNKIAATPDLSRSVNKKMLFCDSSKYLRLKAYTALYLRHFDEARLLFEQYVESIKENGYSYENILAEPILLLEHLKQNPEEALAVLKDNVTKSLTSLKLN